MKTDVSHDDVEDDKKSGVRDITNRTKKLRRVVSLTILLVLCAIQVRRVHSSPSFAVCRVVVADSWYLLISRHVMMAPFDGPSGRDRVRRTLRP